MDLKFSYQEIKEKISGIDPSAWLCIGEGYSREEIKEVLFKEKISFVAQAVTTPDEIILRTISGDKKRNLGNLARQSVLKGLFSQPEIKKHFPLLEKRSKRKDFYRRLDSSLQSGRLSFNQPEELDVLEERLKEKGFQNPFRHELIRFTTAYETFLESSGLYDYPLLLKKGIEFLESAEVHLNLPSEIYFLQTRAFDNLEKSFFDRLAQLTELKFYINDSQISGSTDFNWELWHTVEDATERLVDQISSLSFEEISQTAVLIPDEPEVRRSLVRGLLERGIPLEDPRDPTDVLASESIKKAFLPIEVISSGFEAQKVAEWLVDSPQEVKQVYASGIVRGLESYLDSGLEEVYKKLTRLRSFFGDTISLKKLSIQHQLWLDEVQSDFLNSFKSKLFFEKFWESFLEDYSICSNPEERQSLNVWLNLIKERLDLETDVVSSLKPVSGLKIYRFSQQAWAKPESLRLWIFGLSDSWLTADRFGDDWFFDREREVLSEEFGVRTVFDLRRDRLQILQSWIEASKKVTLLDYQYSSAAEQRVSLITSVRLLTGLDKEPVLMGAHSRWSQSYLSVQKSRSVEVNLKSFNETKTKRISAYALDRYSRCPFQALASARWRLEDSRLSGIKTWADSRGMLIHKALEIYKMKGFSMESSLELAWNSHPPQGQWMSTRLKEKTKNQILRILEKFELKEKEYLERSEAVVFKLEDDELLEQEYFGVKVRGRPDRIDEVEGGLFIIDYKTSSRLPYGDEIIDQGVYLQLPFYAIASQKKYQKPVVGIQFIQVNTGASRSQGLFFKKYNGKEKGKPVQLRSNARSVIDEEASVVWDLLEKKIETQMKRFTAGVYHSAPTSVKECDGCLYQDPCGQKRRA